MTIIYEGGQSPLSYDNMMSAAGALPVFGTTALIDAVAEKVAFVGNVWHPDRTRSSIAIRKVHFRTGAVTLNAASEVRVSLQTVSITAGPPFQPDGVQDQTYDFKTATATLAANAWQATGNLSSDRTVTMSADSAGDANSRRLAVVFEFQVFTAADSVNITDIQSQGDIAGMSSSMLNVGSWAATANRMPVVAFECDDGTFAFMTGSPSISTTGLTASVSSSGAIRRAGLKVRFPSRRAIDRFAMSVLPPNGADGRFVLYDSDGATELMSIDIDNDDIRAVSNASMMDVPFSPVILEANTYYRIVYVSTTATAVTVAYNDVNTAALMDGLIFGQDAHWTQHDGTNWADTTTRRPVFGVGICGFDTGTSGGLMVNSGMTGGMRG